MDESEQIAFALYLATWLKDDEAIEDLDDDFLSRLGKKWRDEWLPGRFAEHNGDCTKKPFTCLRCVMDGFFANAARIKKAMEECCEIIRPERIANECKLESDEAYNMALTHVQNKQSAPR